MMAGHTTRSRHRDQPQSPPGRHVSAPRTMQAAVDMMRKVLSRVDMDGVVVIGEGEKDEAPMLYCGTPAVLCKP